MYELYLKVQNELAFFKIWWGRILLKRKKAIPHGEEQPFLIYKVRGF